MRINVLNYKHCVLFFLEFLLFFLLYSSKAFAQESIITVSPQTGNYSLGQVFTVDIGIEGKGTQFNAAKATVTISETFSIENLAIGDCNFAFVKTPTQTNPSFAGAILGGSANYCTLYTLTLKAINTGAGTVSFSNASIKAYKGAGEILKSLQTGSYTIHPVSSDTNSVAPFSPTLAPLTNAIGTKLYTISYMVSVPKNIPASVLRVVLDPDLPNEKTAYPTTTSTVTFENVPEGVHTIVTMYSGIALSKQIVNIKGNNRTLTFGASEKQTFNFLQYVPYALGFVLLIIIVAVLLYKKLHRNNASTATVWEIKQQ